MHEQSNNRLRGPGRHAHFLFRCVAAFTLSAACRVGAQLPNAPILQNAWATPGIVGALNVAGSSDGSVYAAAAGWSPGSGRFQLSGGLGLQNRTGTGTKAAYGVRAAIPFGGASSTFGFAAFAGIGGGGTNSISVADTLGRPLKADSIPWTTQIPIGAAIGWRHAIGATHGLSVYATPAYVFYTGGSKNGGLFRAAIGADVGITKAIGATAGVDFGSSRPRGLGGPSTAQYGLGVSYAFGRR